jgi:hypothetical protein
MPSLILLTNNNSWNKTSCAILHFSAATNHRDRIMHPHLGSIGRSICACHFLTYCPDLPTYVNNNCHLLSPAFLHRGNSCCEWSHSTVCGTLVQSFECAAEAATSVSVAHANDKSLNCVILFLEYMCFTCDICLCINIHHAVSIKKQQPSFCANL